MRNIIDAVPTVVVILAIPTWIFCLVHIILAWEERTPETRQRGFVWGSLTPKGRRFAWRAILAGLVFIVLVLTGDLLTPG